MWYGYKPRLQHKTIYLAKCGFLLEIKTKIRHLIIFGYHIFTL